MSISASPSPTSSPPPDALRALTARERGLHVLLKAVRSTYRAQRRRPQLEAAYVEWIERFVRLFPDEPVGRVALLHVHTFLQQIERQTPLTPEKRRQAHDALRFLRHDVLYRRGHC